MLYAKFHPRRAFDVRAVVEARINTPLRTRLSVITRRADSDKEYSGMCVEIESVPRRPRNGSSAMYPARSAPGTLMTLNITCCDEFNIGNRGRSKISYILIGYVGRPVPKISSFSSQTTANIRLYIQIVKEGLTSKGRTSCTCKKYIRMASPGRRNNEMLQRKCQADQRYTDARVSNLPGNKILKQTTNHKER